MVKVSETINFTSPPFDSTRWFRKYLASALTVELYSQNGAWQLERDWTERGRSAGYKVWFIELRTCVNVWAKPARFGKASETLVRLKDTPLTKHNKFCDSKTVKNKLTLLKMFMKIIQCHHLCRINLDKKSFLCGFERSQGIYHLKMTLIYRSGDRLWLMDQYS